MTVEWDLVALKQEGLAILRDTGNFNQCASSVIATVAASSFL